MAQFKQSTAYTRMFLLVLASDHVSAATGKTPTVNLSKNGGAFGAAGGVITEIANGWYKIVLTTTDTNTLGDLVFNVTATLSDNTDFADQVVGYDPTAAQLPANVTQWLGAAVLADANNLPKVDVEDVNGSALIETGINLKQALQYCAAALSGVLAGAGGTTVVISAIGNPLTTRITATVDTNGNRSAITLA